MTRALAALRVHAPDRRRLGRLAGDAALVLLFAMVTGLMATNALTHGWVGIDAQIYYRGSAAWLSGGNPWDAQAFFLGSPRHYAALPTTVVLLAPFTLLPEDVFTVGFVAASLVAAVVIIRRLGLPWFAILFPPLTHGVESGNPNVVLLALLLSQRPLLEAIAPLLKVYGVIPLLGRAHWRALAWLAALGGATLLAFPLWVNYVSNFGTYTARLTTEAGSGWSAALLGPAGIAVTLVTCGLLGLRDREAAAWTLVPAVWPATEFHYSVLAMPLIRDRRWLAAMLAIPLPVIPALTPAALVLESSIQRIRRQKRPPLSQPQPPP